MSKIDLKSDSIKSLKAQIEKANEMREQGKRGLVMNAQEYSLKAMLFLTMGGGKEDANKYFHKAFELFEWVDYDAKYLGEFFNILNSRYDRVLKDSKDQFSEEFEYLGSECRKILGACEKSRETSPNIGIFLDKISVILSDIEKS